MIVERLECRSLLSQIGSLDPTFANKGELVLPVQPAGSNGLDNTGSNGLDNIYAIQVQQDGEIDVAGISVFGNLLNYSIHQLNPNGTPDTSFGNGGIAEVAMPTGFSANAKLYAEQIQADGKIVIAGTIQNASGFQQTLVARYNQNGTVDTGFGVDGITVLPAGGLALNYEAIQPNGQIVLAGDIPTSNGVSGNTETAVVRLDANGQLDTGFGSNGLVTLDTVPGAERATTAVTEKATGVAIAPDGQIVLFGDVSVPQAATPQTPEMSAQVFRLNANGSRDTSLSQSGVQAANFAVSDSNGLIVQPNGEILLLGNAPPSYPNGPPILARLHWDGSLDGLAPLPHPNSGYVVNAFALEADGKIVVTGDQFNNYAFVFRLNPDLSMDDTFGVDGVSKFLVPTDVLPKWVANETVAIAPNGEIVLGGLSNNATSLMVSKLTAGDAENPASGPVAPVNASEVAGDYFGEGYAQPTIYLPDVGEFVIREQGADDSFVSFGLSGQGQTIPAPADYDGSGKTELGAYLPSLGEYAYRPANGGPDVVEPFGLSGAGQSIPVPGDYNAIGHDEMAIYLPALGEFAIRDPGLPDQIVPFGLKGVGQTIPAPGDYFGTGRTDIAAYLPTIGAFAIRNPGGGPDEIIPFGLSGLGQSIPVPGDYDGSGKTELAVYMPSLGEFAYRPADGGPDVIVPFGLAGTGQTIPAPGDYDGSGHDEFAAYLPSLGDFAYQSANGSDVVTPFGIAGTANQTIPAPDVFATIGDSTLFPSISEPVSPITAMDLITKKKKS
jgi:uncharacterized delta-60 repeat protein